MQHRLPLPASLVDQCELVYRSVLCSASLSEQYKRLRRASTDPLPEQKRAFLASLVQVILTKLKWDEDAEPEDLDEDENAEFENLRKVGCSASWFKVSTDAPFAGSAHLHGLRLCHRSAARSGCGANACAGHVHCISGRDTNQVERRGVGCLPRLRLRRSQ